jgi:glycosyltransferase involved in cell wall biosynthesis
LARKKILGIYPNYIELYAWMYRVLDDFDVDILSTGEVLSGKVVRPISHSDIPEKNIKYIMLPKILGPPFDYPLRVLYLLFLIPALSLRRYKLVISWGPPHFYSLLLPIFRLFGIKTAVFINDDWVESAIYQRGLTKTFGAKALLRFIEFLSVKFANHAFVVCKYLQSLYRPYNKNSTIAPTSVDIDVIDRIKAKKISTDPTIVYVGAMFEYKGVLLLAKAFEKVLEQVPNAKLLMIGGGPALEELKKLAEKNRSIILTGALDYEKSMALTKGSDVAVIPFKKVVMNYTGSPQKFFDYISCHVPMVYTGGGQHPYYIKKFNVGVECDDNPEDMAEKIILLLKNKKLIAELKKNCIEHAAQVDYRVTFEDYKRAVAKLTA